MTESDRRLVAGARGSALAVRQAEWVGERLREACPGLHVEIRTFVTRGDRSGDRPLPEIGGKGLFTADLEAALRNRDIDIAVHSLKDLPTTAESAEDETGLRVLAIPRREDPRDVLVTRRPVPGVRGLEPGARVGTSSARRAGQILHLRPDVRVVSVRGNVETRIARLEEGAADALLLAAAGLRRLGLVRDNVFPLDEAEWLPAPGQGALAVQGRTDDPAIRAIVERIDDVRARSETGAERALLATLEGGCHAPVAALARSRGEALELRAVVYDPRGERTPIAGRAVGRATRPGELGRELATRLLADGAAELVSATRRREGAG